MIKSITHFELLKKDGDLTPQELELINELLQEDLMVGNHDTVSDDDFLITKSKSKKSTSINTSKTSSKLQANRKSSRPSKKPNQNPGNYKRH